MTLKYKVGDICTTHLRSRRNTSFGLYDGTLVRLEKPFSDLGWHIRVLDDGGDGGGWWSEDLLEVHIPAEKKKSGFGRWFSNTK